MGRYIWIGNWMKGEPRWEKVLSLPRNWWAFRWSSHFTPVGLADRDDVSIKGCLGCGGARNWKWVQLLGERQEVGCVSMSTSWLQPRRSSLLPQETCTEVSTGTSLNEGRHHLNTTRRRMEEKTCHTTGYSTVLRKERTSCVSTQIHPRNNVEWKRQIADAQCIYVNF